MSNEKKAFTMSDACVMSVSDDEIIIKLTRNGKTFKDTKEDGTQGKADYLVNVKGMPTIPGTNIHLQIRAYKTGTGTKKESQFRPM